MPEMFLPPKDALEILRDACGLNEKGEAALQARVRQLIEMGVTGLTRETAHARHRYGLTEIAQLALAVVLMKAHVPPVVAARLAREGWPKFVPFVLSGIGEGLPARFKRLRTEEVPSRALVDGNALADLGSKPVRGSRSGGPLAEVWPFQDEVVGDDMTAAMSNSGTLVDFGSFMPRLFELTVAHAAAPEDVWDALTRLRHSQRPDG